jgi:hypothetical protein
VSPAGVAELDQRLHASNALVRKWAGEDEPLTRRDKDIERLGRLVIDAIYALRAAGNDKEATRLDRKLQG